MYRKEERATLTENPSPLSERQRETISAMEKALTLWMFTDDAEKSLQTGHQDRAALSSGEGRQGAPLLSVTLGFARTCRLASAVAASLTRGRRTMPSHVAISWVLAGGEVGDGSFLLPLKLA